MNTSIAIDKKTKLKAEKRAKEEGLSISTIVRIFLNDYANGKINIGTQVSAISESGFSNEFEDEVLESLSNMDLEGPFKSSKDIAKYLNS
jgi:antitoxin component of RelBE/YafQ-DinJ toxin-antitoxin module